MQDALFQLYSLSNIYFSVWHIRGPSLIGCLHDPANVQH